MRSSFLVVSATPNNRLKLAARRMPKRSRVTLATVRRLALAFPGVEEGLSYGTPGFRVRGKFLARLWEDGQTLVVRAIPPCWCG